MLRNPAILLGLVYGLVGCLSLAGLSAAAVMTGGDMTPEALLVLAVAAFALRPDRPLRAVLPALRFTADVQCRAEAALTRGLKEAKGLLVLEGRPRDKPLLATIFLDGIDRRVSVEGVLTHAELQIVEALLIRTLGAELAPREIAGVFARLQASSFSPPEPQISNHDLLRIRARHADPATPAPT